MEQQVQGSRTRRTRQQIEDILQEFHAEGCTAKQFCERRQLSRPTFDKWMSRQKKQSSTSNRSSSFSRIKVPPGVEKGLFAEVGSVKIYHPVTAAYLKELMS